MTSRRAAGEAIPATSAVPAEEKTPSKAPERAAVDLGIEELEAVEEDAGGDTGVAHVRDGELVRRREERDGDVGLHAVRHGAVEGLLGHEGPVHEDLDVVVHDGDGVGAALQIHDEPRGLGRGRVEAVEGEGLGLAHAGAEGLPLPQVLDVEDVGSEEAVGLEGGEPARGNAGRSVRRWRFRAPSRTPPEPRSRA